MNFKKMLDDGYDEATKKLYARSKKIEDRLGEFDPQEGERLKAKIETLEHRSRESFGDGKDEAVAGYEEEIQKIQNELQADSEEMQSLNTEREAIQRQIDLAASQTLVQVFPKIQEEVLEVWDHAIGDAERAWTALQEFGIEHQIKVSFHVHHGGLSPRGDKLLRSRLEKWVD